ncbi:PB1 domain-containing protein/Pkinase_Tyr domain-containing protein [Cephalotus follicularis]|uniref:PB1 domain-containing protein/Pkinase_Tyr domain-containing protein n=1 Tax=Cephalotus follicularis TaxID=3775 RepID=A0A1Q3C0V0_CEPFO|nr:PB1 domain-containing protein/Pkinase_Tyr domain-containing protein [Cephalotus follicularis]
MAFDQNSIPKDLRPLNVTRTVTEDPRIAVATTIGRNPDGFFPNPAREAANLGSIPIFYPATVSDTGFVGLGYGNMAPGVSPWAPRMPVPVGQVGMNPPAVGFGYGPNLGNRVVLNAVDQAGNDGVSGIGYGQNFVNLVNGYGSDQVNNELVSGSSPNANSGNLGTRNSGNGSDYVSEEGGDDSVSGKKIKFLCSFGGKILPRPSDGVLRYVGGQTRIISLRRDMSYNELTQKMVDTYGQPVVIKYQLPDEELDALVSVSCPDDLDNMMDEYEKLVERSSDGSAKLRVFLFSASELDLSGMMQYGDLHDSGHRYVEAVNGINDGVGGGIARKESMASATSTQNSDISGNEVVVTSGASQGDVTGPPSTTMSSPTGNSACPRDSAPRLVCVDPTPAVYADVSGFQMGFPLVKSGTPQNLSSQPEVESEKSVPLNVLKQQSGFGLQQPAVEIPPPAAYTQAYVDPCQEVVNHAGYLHLPPQMGYPNSQFLGTVGSIYTQPQLRDHAAGLSPHQFIPAVHMTMTPSSPHIGLRPTTMVQPLMQPQQTLLEHYPDESTFGTRVVQLPVDPSYNAYQAQVSHAVVGGGYAWPQIPQPDHFVFSDGSASQKQILFSEKIPRLEDCYMCQKALPHAHSDPLAQGQRDTDASPVSYSNSVHHTLSPDDAMRFQPINMVVMTGALGEGIVEQGAGTRSQVSRHMDQQVGLAQNMEARHETERSILPKIDNSDHPKIAVNHGIMGLAGDVQPPYGVLIGSSPESCQEDANQQHFMPIQSRVKQEASLKVPANIVSHHVGGVHDQSSERLVYESPKGYSGKLPGIVPNDDPVDSCLSYDQLKPIDGIMETLWKCTPEVTSEQNKSLVDRFRKEDVLDNRPHQIGGRELRLDDTLSKHQMVLDTNQNKASEVLPCTSTEVSYMHNSRPMESYDEMAQPPILGEPSAYQQTKIEFHQLDRCEFHYDSQPANINDRIPNMVPSDAETAQWGGNSPSHLSPSNRAKEVQESSNSLFSIQDPWNTRPDTHFPPPRPSRVQTKNEAFGARDPFCENHLGISAELNAEPRWADGVHMPLSNSSKDFTLEHAQSSKGSSEDLIRQELKAVAEGVAASVFQPATQSSPDSSTYERIESANETNLDRELPNSNVEMQHRAKFEDIKTKLPEKVNLGFPVSDGIGRLQIITNSDLEELRELGSGTFGTVYHGKWRGTDVAIKRINDRCFAGKPSEQERMRDDFWNEAIKLADLHHPNVVAFYGVVLDGPGGSVATVTEYMVNGSLRNALQKNEKNVDKRKRLLIAMDVAFGMEYLHGKNIVHFDLKSDNLLVNLRDPHRPICKVGDLGLSKVKCHTLISGGVRGTLPWMAPELLNGSSSLVSEKVDVFSFGIVLWELLTGEEPYADLHYGAIIGGIVSNTLRPPVPEYCDPEWRSLMERCWSPEPSERPSFTEIVKDLRVLTAKIPSKGQNPTQQVPS